MVMTRSFPASLPRKCPSSTLQDLASIEQSDSISDEFPDRSSATFPPRQKENPAGHLIWRYAQDEDVETDRQSEAETMRVSFNLTLILLAFLLSEVSAVHRRSGSR